MTFICLGIAIAASNLWIFLLLLAVVVVMTIVVIPREERYLTQKFGAAYTEYMARVRRWV